MTENVELSGSQTGVGSGSVAKGAKDDLGGAGVLSSYLLQHISTMLLDLLGPHL